MNQVVISFFFGSKRIAVFHSMNEFHLYLVQRGLPHQIDSNGEVDICELDGYWYN